jgi:hypothetical protein
MMMIKSNGGSGFMKNVLMQNFIGYSNAYSLDIDQQWSSMKTLAGSGVHLSNITFKVRKAPSFIPGIADLFLVVAWHSSKWR